ncbi:MAG TPA: YjbE family putative metal transport protein [Caulobacterales bacterium]|nr:YjbE family putative metal transport protein [Caulobacterales bacterium]
MDFDIAGFGALVQVVLIDLALAGDNAVAVGLAAAGLPAEQRRRAIFWGVLGALVLRIGFALVTVQLLQIHGILLFGGLLLFWVAWRMWRDMQHHAQALEQNVAPPPKSFAAALFTIIIADVSMSLDNVLAVAGIAREHPVILAFGLVLSVVLMGLAANIIARIIEKNRWIAIVGIVVIIIAGAQMILEDAVAFKWIPPLPWMHAAAH